MLSSVSNYSTYLGGLSGGLQSVLSISNRQFGISSGPHLRLHAINDAGSGSWSQLQFSNNYFPSDNHYTFSAYTGSNRSLHHFRLNYRNSIDGQKILMSFDSSTKMGIGMNAWKGKLTIAHKSSVASSTLDLLEKEDDYGGLSFSNELYSSFWTIAGRSSEAATNRRVNSYYSDYSDVMSLTSDGNVGVAPSILRIN